MILDKNEFVMNLLLFIHFGSDSSLEVTCSLHVFHLWYRGKLHQLGKPLLYYLLLKRNICVVKTIFIICLLFSGE